MKTKLIGLYLLVTVAVVGAASITLDDRDLAKRLIGTWIDDPAEAGSVVSTATYRADGTGTETVRWREQTESLSVQVTTRWSITNGLLCIKSVASTDPKRIPTGIEIKDRIISVSAEKFVYEAFEGYSATDGKRRTKIRRRGA